MAYVPGLEGRRFLPALAMVPIMIIAVPIALVGSPLMLPMLFVWGVRRRRVVSRVIWWTLATVFFMEMANLLLQAHGFFGQTWVKALIVVACYQPLMDLIGELRSYWKAIQHERKRPPMWYR
jgi:hypothetical protein